MRRSGPRVSFKGHADSDEEYHSRSPVSPREIPDSQPGSPNHDFDELQSSNPVLPREIPDSQPDTSSHGFDGAEEPDDSVSFKTEATVVIPGGTQLTPKPEPRYVSSRLLYILFPFVLSILISTRPCIPWALIEPELSSFQASNSVAAWQQFTKMFCTVPLLTHHAATPHEIYQPQRTSSLRGHKIQRRHGRRAYTAGYSAIH